MQTSELIKLKGQMQITIWNNSGVLDIEVQTGKAKGDYFIESRLKMPFTDEQVLEELDKLISRLVDKLKADANSL